MRRSRFYERPYAIRGQLGRPRIRLYALIVAFALFLLWFTLGDFSRAGELIPCFPYPKVDKPPTYEKIDEYQRNLPQHNLDLPFPEGRTGRYVKFSCQIQMLGWNNVFNELLMNTQCAYEAKRAYVFQDYYWKREYYHWQDSLKHNWHPRTPLSAIISGPSVGGPWDEGDPAPRSIHSDWFDVVCPVAERRIVNTRDVKPWTADSPANEVFDSWVKFLKEAPERCIEIVPAPRKEDGFPQVFDLWFWSKPRIISIWDYFSKTPTSRLLGNSPIVESGVKRNEYLFLPRGPKPNHPVSRDPYDRMMAIHIRRGDYIVACEGLWTWNSTFYSWNLLPFLPDRFEPLPGGGWGWNTPENRVTYMEHCLPTFEQVVKKVRDARHDYIEAGKDKGGYNRTLDVMYLLTNEQGEWLDGVKDVLRKDGWHTIVTSKGLELDKQQRDVDMAIDMDIARRAAVFIGNGWSSFTSNIVHRRLVDGKENISCRFY